MKRDRDSTESKWQGEENMSVRESIFVCRFVSEGGSRTARVRAWDEREAVEVFRDELVEEGLHESGTIEIVGSGGPSRLTAAFQPDAATT